MTTNGGSLRPRVGLRHGCGPSAEMRDVRRRVRLRRKCRRRRTYPRDPASTSNSGRFPGIGEKVMQERSEMRFLHHFLRGRRVD